MTVGEATAVNTVLRALAKSGPAMSIEEVEAAGRVLARGAQRVLNAGMGEERWAREFFPAWCGDSEGVRR